MYLSELNGFHRVAEASVGELSPDIITAADLEVRADQNPHNVRRRSRGGGMLGGATTAVGLVSAAKHSLAS